MVPVPVPVAALVAAVASAGIVAASRTAAAGTLDTAGYRYRRCVVRRKRWRRRQWHCSYLLYHVALYFY